MLCLPPSLRVSGGLYSPPSVCGIAPGEMATVWGDYHRQAVREWCLRKPERTRERILVIQGLR